MTFLRFTSMWLFPKGRSIAFRLLSVCLFSCTLFAQGPSASADQKFTVSGTVVNTATGEAIPRALVTLQGDPTRNTFTDTNGSFSFEAVPAGQHAASAQKPGYFGSQETSGSIVRNMQFVDVGPNTDPATIKLEPENIIFGRLTDANGQPVESVSVRLTQRVVRNGRSRWEQRGWAQSDEEGSYRFANLQPGTYYLSAGPDLAHRDALFATPDQPRTGWPGLYFPEAPDLASASPIRVHSGQHFQADMVINRVPLFVVSGVVSGTVPNRGFSVQVQNSSGEPVSVGTRLQHDSGRFEMQLPSGTYRLKATSDTGEQHMRAEVRLTVEKDLNQVQLVLQPAVSIPIRVRMDDRGQNLGQGPGAAGRYARAISGPAGDAQPPVSVHLMASAMGENDVYSSYMGATGNRVFALRGIDPGRYTADISSYGGWYVESAQCGNTNLMTEDLVVNAGTSCLLEISLRNDYGTLNVSIKSAEQGASGIAVLMPARGRAAPRSMPFFNAGQAKGAAAPNFMLSDIAPGDYLLYAFDSPEAVEFSNPEALRPYTSQATPVTISPGQTVKATAQIIQTGAASE
jgi:hypothetical protein